MARIKTLLNDRGQARTGLTYVNTLNVCPTTQVATSGGATIESADFIKYDYFNVDQTSSDNDIILIPAGLPIGTVVYLFALDVVEVRVSGSETFNTEASTTEYAMVAGGVLRMIKSDSLNWICNNISSAGAITAANPD